MATAAEVKRARRAKRAAATLDDPPPQPILRAASANDCVATKLGWLTQYQWGTADATAAPTVPETESTHVEDELAEKSTSLRTEICFETSTPLPRPSADCQGIALFAAAALAHSKTASAAEDAAPSWERGLLYWLYPSAGLPASSNAGARFRQAESSSASDSVGADYWRQRRRHWEDAFRSLYLMMRRGACITFYLHTPQFTVVWRRAEDQYEAVMDGSTSQLRQQLQQERVEFKGPDGQHLADAQPRSALGDERLVFSGHMAVHGLFDFLMNNHALPGSTRQDVPTLLARYPFVHGALQELQPSFSGRVKRSRHERVTHVYQLTLKGWVLPDACEELTAAAKSMCEGSVVVSTRSSPS